MEQSLNIKRKRTRRASVATAMASACAAVIAATVMAGASPGVAQEATREPGTAVPQSGGVEIVNYFRALGNVAPVSGNVQWSREAMSHARYTVATGTIAHNEDPDSPHYTPGGEKAAGVSIVTGASQADYPESYMVSDFASAPFHAVSMLDPRLSTIGYGVHRDPASSSGLGSALVMDVHRGNADAPWSEDEPVMWPGDGKVSPVLAVNSGERPDPLAGCGYAPGAGGPIYVMTPEEEGPYAFEVRDSSGAVLEACSYDATTYRNSDASAQRTGRYHLAERNAIVIVTREALRDHETYTVGVTTCSREIEWSFGTAYAPETYTPSAPVDVTVGEPAACSNPPVDPDPDGPGTDEPPIVKPNLKPYISSAKVKVSRAPRSKAAVKRPRPVSITAVVRDGDQNLQRSNIVVKLDGKTVRKGVKYAPASDRLSMKMKVRKGRHTVTIQARDSRGAVVTKTIRFKAK